MCEHSTHKIIMSSTRFPGLFRLPDLSSSHDKDHEGEHITRKLFPVWLIIIFILFFIPYPLPPPAFFVVVGGGEGGVSIYLTRFQTNGPE